MIKILSTLQIKGYFLSFIKRIYPKKQLLIGSHKLRRKQKRILWKRTVKGDVYSWGFEQAEEEAWGSFLAPIPLLAIGAMPSLWGWGAEMRQGDTAVPLTPTPQHVLHSVCSPQLSAPAALLCHLSSGLSPTRMGGRRFRCLINHRISPTQWVCAYFCWVNGPVQASVIF